MLPVLKHVDRRATNRARPFHPNGFSASAGRYYGAFCPTSPAEAASSVAVRSVRLYGEERTVRLLGLFLDPPLEFRLLQCPCVMRHWQQHGMWARADARPRLRYMVCSAVDCHAVACVNCARLTQQVMNLARNEFYCSEQCHSKAVALEVLVNWNTLDFVK